MYPRNLEKLWNGLASIRDYELDKAIKQGGVKFSYKDKTMTITAEDLKSKKFQCHSREFNSVYNPGQKYTLIDFKFVEDKETKVIEKIEEDKQKILL